MNEGLRVSYMGEGTESESDYDYNTAESAEGLSAEVHRRSRHSLPENAEQKETETQSH